MSDENFDKLPVSKHPSRDPIPMLRDIKVDLLKDSGRKILEATNQIANKRIREAAQKHYGFNPENS